MMPWLDASGMALYLLARVKQLNIESLVPPDVYVRLEQNQVDNRHRTAWLLDEMAEVMSRMNAAGIPFAFLKGLTLAPDAVPDPALRCQTDIDLLAPRVRAFSVGQILNEMGYILHADGNGTAEFKTSSATLGSCSQMYSVRPQRAIEVHWVGEEEEVVRASIWLGQLDRTQKRSIAGVLMPCLSGQDQLLNQMLHLFGHLRSEHTRASWILEITRNLQTKSHDDLFWDSFNRLVHEVPDAFVACGCVVALIRDVFGYEAPAEVATYICDLPAPVLHWIKTYGLRIAIGDAPGSKLYLLLEAALSADPRRAQIFRCARLLPLRLPPMVLRGPEDQPISFRVRRYVAQCWFVFYRFRFHLRALFEYVVERNRWNRYIRECLGK